MEDTHSKPPSPKHIVKTWSIAPGSKIRHHTLLCFFKIGKCFCNQLKCTQYNHLHAHKILTS